MKEIHKIQVEINGIPVIALVDNREAYSFVITTFIKRWNLKVKRSFPCKIASSNGLKLYLFQWIWYQIIFL